MCRKLSFLLLTVGLSAGAALGAVPITVENYSFEIPDDGQKHDIDVGTPGVVTGWARVDPITSAGRELGWSPTEGTYTGFMGKNAVIFNLTDFLMMEGDEFRMIFDARSTWQGSYLLAQLYYGDEEDRVAFATTTVDLSQQSTYGTFIVDSNAVGPAMNDQKIGIQFTHQYVEGLWPDDNIWAGLDYIALALTSPLMRAQDPFPAHESSYAGESVTLTWVPGPNAPAVDSYQVYLSENWADVNEGTPAADKGSTSTASHSVSDLVQGQTYYWRIDTAIGANVYRGNIWNFTAKPLVAYNPDPVKGAQFASVEPMLTWEAGSGAAQGHVVFLGDNFDDVSNAPIGTSGSPPFRAYLTNPADTNWVPSEAGLALLQTSTTYYWRIDEVESTEPQTIHKGEVWSFTTVPIKGLGSITRDLYEGIPGGAVTDLTDDPNYPDGPSQTGFLASFEAPHMAISEYGSRVYGWLYVRNSGGYTFWIASGEQSQLWLGNHPSTATMIASVDAEAGRDGWTQPREYDKYPEIQQSDPINLQGDGTLYYIMVLHKKGWGYDNLSVAWSGPDSNGAQEIIPGTSLIPFDQVTLLGASGPTPANRATDVRRDPILSWMSGEYAAVHDVYFGTDFDDVNEASRGNDPCNVLVRQDQIANTYEPGILEFYTTYYWRVDEVNSVNPDSPWAGYVWNFTVGDFLVVDDFEDYNDTEPYTVWNAWQDGYFDPTSNGSTVGHENEPYAEQTIVHGGDQSMPVDYNNAIAGLSEATKTLTSTRDWTEEGVRALSLWFRGHPASFGGFTEEPAGTYTMTSAGADIWDQADQFHYAYKTLTGVGSIEAKVESVQDTDGWAKAGVMIRETLEPGSKFAAAYVTPGNGVRFQLRADTGVDATDDGEEITTEQMDINAPHWVKMERDMAGEFTCYHSSDGSDWQLMAWSPQNIPMSTDVHIGLALTSHATDVPCEAVFSNVILSENVSGDWEHQDIGIPSNDAEPMYVAVANNTGAPAVVYHDDPNAAQINTWTQWPIPLKDFESQGVDLTDVNSITIGFGDRDNPQAGGEGTMYFDDIRLYRPGCFPSKIALEADLNDDCMVDLRDLEVMAGDWLSGEADLAADINADSVVDFKDYAILADEWLDEQQWPQP